MKSIWGCLRADQSAVEWIIEVRTYCPEVKTCITLLHHSIRAPCSPDSHHLDCLREGLGTDGLEDEFTNVLSESLKGTLDA